MNEMQLIEKIEKCEKTLIEKPVVYIVIEHQWEDSDITGVYSDKESAQKEVDAHDIKHGRIVGEQIEPPSCVCFGHCSAKVIETHEVK